LAARPVRFTGAADGELGIAVAMLDVAPLPAEVTALTRKRMVTPLSSPFNVWVVAVVPVFATASVHVVPPSTVCSMR